MGIHMYFFEDRLRTVLAFEDGRVELWECREWAEESDVRLDKPAGWVCLWREKGHNEASESTGLLGVLSRPTLADLRMARTVVMAMTVSPRLDFAFTVSADHQLVRYSLNVSMDDGT